MRLLIKFPTRGRPQKFLSTLQAYYEMLSGLHPVTVVVSADIDDPTMNNQIMIETLSQFTSLYLYLGNSKTKVEAINADIQRHPRFDILLLASDDMIPVVKGYDHVVAECMRKFFPDTDGVLHFNDGNHGPHLNTLAIMGKRYYDRFGYIYHPSYKSLWCDNEFMQIAQQMKRQVYFDEVIIRHLHPCFTGEKQDELMVRNLGYNQRDAELYQQRLSQQFTESPEP